MKKKTKKTLLSIFCCGLLAASALSITAGVTVSAEEPERVAPTGTYTGTLVGEIPDSMLDSFQVYGASTRKAGIDGLRFLSTIENDDLALIPQGAEFGTILIPYRMLGEEELTKDTAKALVAPAKVVTDAAEVPENGMGYYITLVGEQLTSSFPTNLYGTVFAARAYVKYTYENAYGEMVEDYAYSTKTTYRSIGYVASCELASRANAGDPDNDENSFLNRIVSEVAAQKEMSVSLSEAEINIGKTAVVTVSGISDGVNEFAYSISSSNESVAKIGENGEIEAIGAGTTTITARIGLTERTVELTVKDPDEAETFTGGNILYSTKDGTIFMPNGLLDAGETIVSAKVGGVDYFNADGWDALALTDAEIKANATKTTTLTIKTSDGDAHKVDAISYAGVIDELKDFVNFFSTDHNPSAYPPPTYGHYIIIKNIGTLEDDLAITCSDTPAYNVNKLAGFSGIVDGLGHTVKFNLTKGGLFGSILGNCIIRNLSVVFKDNTPNHYGVFGHWAEQYPQIINCYIAQQNNHYLQSTTYGIMRQLWGRVVLKNTVVFGNNFTFTNNAGAGRTNISADSENAFVIWGRTQVATDTMLTANFTEVSTSGALTKDLSGLDSKYWNTTDNKPSWKQAADTAVSVYSEAYQAPIPQVEDKLLYSTKDGAMILPESLQGATIVDAYSEDKAVDYYENAAWQNLALTDAELNANATKDTTFIIETDKGKYSVTATSYAGVIDELDDFPRFFDNDASASVAPNVYGYYIVTKDLGDGTEKLSFTQCANTNYTANCGFQGVLDGQGHTLRFKLTSGGLVGMILGNATIKNLGVIFEDLTATKYGVFGYMTHGTPVIENCYIEQMNNHFGKTVYGIMARPNIKLQLKNTVVYGFNISTDIATNYWSNAWLGASSNAYVIHARATANTFNIAKNFTKIFNDGIEDGSREVLLSEIADASGFDDNYWYKENGKLIWKGLETVNITWVDGDNVTVEPFTKGDVMSFAALEGAYWSKTENGSQATMKDVRPEEDCTYYLVSTTKRLKESAYYSTLNNEFFLPTEFTNAENGFVSITSVDGSIVYYENEEWIRSFALTPTQIANNQMVMTPIKINVEGGAYLTTVKSYAGVIDELSDFPAFFNTANETNDAVNTYGYYVVIRNLVSPDEVVTMSHTTGYGWGNSGFLGILDGMGHTVSCTLKGYLLNNELGNCLIKNIALKIKLRPTGNDPIMSNVGILADLCNKGTPVIENSYFEVLGEAPNFNGDSTWWLMYRSKKNLTLKNVVVQGNAVTKAQTDEAFQISEDSENAFIIWARSNLVSAGQATNFKEVSTSGALTSDLSVLNSNYWTTTSNKPNWKGAEDVAVTSVGTVTVAPKPLDVYKIVLPEAADASGNLELAKNELISFFAEATGVTLEVVADNAYATTEAYISIGNTKMYERAALDLGDAHGQGYRIQTVDNALFINAESTIGCVYGVYGLLNELFGYEQFSVDCYTLNKVEMDVLPEMDITENPSFNARVPVSGTVTANKEYAARMHMANVKYMLEAGDTANNGGYWRENHNVLEILPPSRWSVEEPNWFSDVKINGAINQLCYTAHGNTTDYAEMVAQIAKVFCEVTIKNDGALSKEKHPEAIYVALSSEDGNGVCTCSACKSAKSTYGSDAGAVLKLCNDVRERIEEWMTANERYRRNVTLLFLAYNDYYSAPASLDSTTGTYKLNGGLTMRSDVGVYFAGSSDAQYYQDFDGSYNADFKTELKKWADVTNASGSPLCLWTYSLNNNEYLIHTDMYGEGKFYNESAYQYFKEMGVDLYYNQGPWNATETVTAFNRLNIYLDSQMMWDCTQSVSVLTDKYFNAMYGAGASYMKQLYNAENAASRELFDPDIEGVPNDTTNSFESWWGVLSSSNINKWLGYITSAKNAVNADTTLTDEQKAAYISHINEEWIAVKYWQMRYHGSSIKEAAKAEFREVLGYDANTGKYAKDVIIGERYDYTLTAWIENNFVAP